MKWNFLKRKKGKTTASRATAGGRRITGVQLDLPPSLNFAIKFAATLLVLALTLWGIWALFNLYYFRANDLFTLHDLHGNVRITTGKTLSPDLVCEVLGLKEGVNLFSIPIEAKRREMLERAPNIRSMEIMRRLPDRLTITIVERDPIARVGKAGQVVDEEGVVFVRYADTGNMPFIKGADTTAEFMPGDRLRGNDIAAVQVVNDTLRPQSRMRLAMVDASKSDYLLLTMIDNRQAKLAWEGMGSDSERVIARMRRQMDELEKVLESDIGKVYKMLNATIPGRIFVSMGGTQ